jgi:CDP-diacylglycerol---glycerol-3-phosphate 3-phosphatidyltransferase
VSLYALKPAFQLLLQPHVGRLARGGVTANQVTLAAALGSLAVGGLVAAMAPARWPFLLIPIWLFLRMALNAIDGMLARNHGQKSRLGAYLNELSDVVSDAALYAPFALLPAFGGFWIALVILLAALTELSGVLGPTVGASRRYDGPMGKSDRALVFGALGLWAGLGGPLPPWTSWIMVALVVLLALTCVNRVRAGLKEHGRAP